MNDLEKLEFEKLHSSKEFMKEYTEFGEVMIEVIALSRMDELRGVDVNKLFDEMIIKGGNPLNKRGTFNL